jgi:hypothetical protein
MINHKVSTFLINAAIIITDDDDILYGPWSVLDGVLEESMHSQIKV